MDVTTRATRVYVTPTRAFDVGFISRSTDEFFRSFYEYDCTSIVTFSLSTEVACDKLISYG